VHTAQHDTKSTSLPYERFAGKVMPYNENNFSEILVDRKCSSLVVKSLVRRVSRYFHGDQFHNYNSNLKRTELSKLRDRHMIHSCDILTLLGSVCVWILTV